MKTTARTAQPPIEVTVKHGHNHATIYLHGVPHVKFALETYLGFQSWLWTKPQPQFSRGLQTSPTYEIELYFTDAPPIRLQYDDANRWKAILAKLDEL